MTGKVKKLQSAASQMPPAIADAIRRDIHSGTYEPGRHLGTIELAERFDVSRGTVREALRLLEPLHLIRIVPQKGAFVIAPDDEEIQDLLTIRGALFALECEIAAQAGTAETLAPVAALAVRMCELADDPDCTPRHFQRVQYEMAEAIGAVAANARLTNMIREATYGAGIAYGHLALATADMRKIEADQFVELVRLMQAGDAAGAFAAARRQHDVGVKRAMDLAKMLPRAHHGELKGRRIRRNR